MGFRVPARARSLGVRWILPALLGIGGAAIGTASFGRASESLGPFDVTLGARFGRGVTDVELPPLGHLTADTHDAPLRLSATLTEVDVRSLQSYLRDHSLDQLASAIETSAERSLVPFAARTLAVGLAGATALGLVTYRRNVRPILVAAVAGVVVVGSAEA